MVAPDRDRLRRAFGLGRPSERAPVRPESDAAPDRGGMREFLQRRRAQLARGEVAPRTVVTLPPGEECRGEDGAYWRRELCYGQGTLHGAIELDRARHLDGERLSALAKDASFGSLRAEECLFLDTETTGLAGGAGTVVFTYGLGFFARGEFVFEQLFLRDFGEELAVLRHVAARLAEFPVLVTFVGKSYDRHRIHARMLVHKLTSPVLTPRHLDLYHLVRRSHGKQLPDARLRTVEEHLLGLRRHDDLPGSEAPAAFFDWIKDRSGPVDRVLEHNRLDVLSLCALLGVLAGAASPA